MISIPKDHLIVIPARYESSRFPGKPLVDVFGFPMVIQVARRCLEIASEEQVVIATDDQRIADVAEAHGVLWKFTSTDNKTGTDRVAEIAVDSKFEHFINVQGDEPFISSIDILEVVKLYAKYQGKVVATGFCEFLQSSKEETLTIPKIVVSQSDKVLYVSRANVPYPYQKVKLGNNGHSYTLKLKRQVCVYAFSKRHLEEFSKRGDRTEVETLEDIELLRFLELGTDVRATIVGESFAVDTPEDLQNLRSKFLEYESNPSPNNRNNVLKENTRGNPQP